MSISIILIGAILYSIFLRSCRLMKRKISKNINRSHPVVSGLKEVTSFTIKKSGEYELWASYGKRAVGSTFKNKSPWSFKESYFGTYPTLTSKKSRKTVLLRKGSQFGEAWPDIYDHHYLVCKSLDYLLYLEKGEYHFERKHFPEKKQPLIKQMIFNFMMHQYQQKGVPELVNEPITYYLQEASPPHLTLLIKCLKIISGFAIFCLILGLLIFILKVITLP